MISYLGSNVGGQRSPHGKSSVLISGARRPSGVSLFQCNLLSHEDKGMMAKILFK